MVIFQHVKMAAFSISLTLLVCLSPVGVQADFSFVVDELVYDETALNTYDINYQSGDLTYDGSFYHFPGTTPCWVPYDGVTIENSSKGPRITAPAGATDDGFLGGGCSGAGQFSFSVDFCDFADMQNNQYIYHFGLSSGNTQHPASYQVSLEAMWATGTFNDVAYTNALVLAPGRWLMSDDSIGEENLFVIAGLDPTRHTVGLKYTHVSSTQVNFYYRINKGSWVQFHSMTTPNGYYFENSYPGINAYLSSNPAYPSGTTVPLDGVLTPDIPASTVSLSSIYELLILNGDAVNDKD